MSFMRKLLCLMGIGLAVSSYTALAQDAQAPAPASPDASAAAPVAAAAPSRIADMFDAPPPDRALVVFYRPGGMGGLVGCMVREGEGADERHLSKLTGNRYFVEYAKPGRHEYWVKSEATDRLALEVDGGEAYFVRCKINMGLMVGRPNIGPSDLAEFEKYKAKLKLMKPEEMADDTAQASTAAASK